MIELESGRELELQVDGSVEIDLLLSGQSAFALGNKSVPSVLLVLVEYCESICIISCRKSAPVAQLVAHGTYRTVFIMSQSDYTMNEFHQNWMKDMPRSRVRASPGASVFEKDEDILISI